MMLGAARAEKSAARLGENKNKNENRKDALITAQWA